MASLVVKAWLFRTQIRDFFLCLPPVGGCHPGRILEGLVERRLRIAPDLHRDYKGGGLFLEDLRLGRHYLQRAT